MLEALLATPCAALHIRTNLLRTTRLQLLEAITGKLDGFDVRPHTQLDDVIVVLRRRRAPELAPYLMIKTNGPERFGERKRHNLPPHEIMVDRVCGEAVLKGADVFVRGVRAASAGLVAGSRVSVYADLYGTCLRGSVCKSTEGMRLLGCGVCCQNRPALFREESGLAVHMEHIVDGDLPALSGVLEGMLYVQTLPSLVAAHVLAARPGEKVLDMCSCPGSKSTHIATNFLRDAPGSLLVACERNHGKLAKLATLCTTMGLSCVSPTRADTTLLGAADARVPGLRFPSDHFDRVLLDPPCSALGLRPKLLQTPLDNRAFGSQTAYQRRFLRVAVRVLRVGGVLVYSTCTLTPEENETQVANALRRYPCLALVHAEPRVGGTGRPGCGLSDEHCQMVQRFEPQSGCEGFFIAKFIKARAFEDQDEEYGSNGEYGNLTQEKAKAFASTEEAAKPATPKVVAPTFGRLPGDSFECAWHWWRALR